MSLRVRIMPYGPTDQQKPFEATFVGLLQEVDSDPVVVVRIDGHGLMLQTFHPSRVVLLDPEGDELGLRDTIRKGPKKSPRSKS